MTYTSNQFVFLLVNLLFHISFVYFEISVSSEKSSLFETGALFKHIFIQTSLLDHLLEYSFTLISKSAGNLWG